MANGNGERQLFHGFAVIIFAVAGVCTVASRNRDEGSADTRRRAVLAYGLIAALALWISIGPGPWRPYVPGHVAEVVRGLRRAGVRYVLLHEATFVEPEMARRIVGELQTADDQIAEAHEWPGTWAWRLKDIDPRPPPAPNLALLDPKAFGMRASHEPSRLPLIFDGNLDTRWLTGERQAGTEWVEVRLPRPAHLRRLEIVGGGRSVLDYPQRLRIDSTHSTGVSQVLFDDSIVEPYVESVAFNDLHPSVALDLPRNQTVVLRIQQTGRGANWWSIYELKIWEQKEER